jgi:aspartyl-tRNA(Asn)/glutamyl-tRNA(Gln) amidotransferase subunit B
VNERGVEISEVSISPEALAGLIRLVEEGRLTTKNAKDLLPELVDQGGDPEALMLERGLEAVSDAGLIDALVDEVMAAQGEAVELVRAGDDKPLNFLMGKVMKASQGKANPAEVRGRLIEKIRGASAGQIDS